MSEREWTLKKKMCRNVNVLQKRVSLGVLSILMGIVVMSCMGCGQEAPPPPPSSKVEKTEPPPPSKDEEAKAPEVAPTPTFFYDATGRREPFKSLLEDEMAKEIDPLLPPIPGEEQTPLQNFDLNQIKITGIILGGLGDYAKVKAPDGKAYTINVGTPVGNHEGKVTRIEPNTVTVKEIFRYASGKVEEVESLLYLIPVKEGEKP